MHISSLAHLLCLALLPSAAFAQSTFSGSGNWLDDKFWDLGIPGDGSTATVNGECIINENIVAAQALNPSRVNIGDTTGGKLTCTGYRRSCRPLTILDFEQVRFPMLTMVIHMPAQCIIIGVTAIRTTKFYS